MKVDLELNPESVKTNVKHPDISFSINEDSTEFNIVESLVNSSHWAYSRIFTVASSGPVFRLDYSWGVLQDPLELPWNETRNYPYAQIYLYSSIEADFGHVLSILLEGSSTIGVTGFDVFTDSYEYLGTAMFGVTLTLPSYTGSVRYLESNGAGGPDGMSTSGNFTLTTIDFTY